MKVFLLNPPFVEGYSRDACWQASGRAGTFRFPIWLGYATAQLSSFADVKLVDAVARRLTLSYIMLDIGFYDPDYVVVNTNWASLKDDKEVAQKLREHFPKISVIEFGIPSDINDYQLHDKLIGNPTLKPDEIPFVSKIYKQFLQVEDYSSAECFHPFVQIWAHGVTCPFHCTFCNRPHRTSEFTSPKRAVDEVEWIRHNLPQVREIHYEDDTFTLDKEWVWKFCQEIEARQLDFVWSSQVRADVPLGLLEAMKEAGCRLVICGFESGNNEVLRLMKKGTTVEQCVTFAENVRKVGIMLQMDVVFGLRGETKDTIQDSQRLIKQVGPDLLQCTIATPYPRTEFYDYINANRYFVDGAEYLNGRGLQMPMISYPWLSDAEIAQAVSETLREYYGSLQFYGRVLRQVFSRHGWQEFKRLYRGWRQLRI